MSDNQNKPIQTLYINNINEKIKIDDLKQALTQLFSQFGKIIEVRARKNIKMKGQAFITYESVEEATKAKSELNNKNFLGKELKIDYAKTLSDIVLINTGQLTKEEKKEKDLQRKRRRDEEYEKRKKELEKEIEMQNAIEEEEINANEKEEPNKIVLDENANNILYVEQIPKEMSEAELKEIFNAYPGFKDLRIFSSRGIAFVEYDNIINAATTLIKLSSKEKEDKTSSLKVTYAKK